MLNIEPDNNKHWNSKGVILAKLDRMDGSISAFDRALEIDPKAPKSWYSKGVVLMDSGRIRAALGCFYKTLDIDPVFEKGRERFLKCLDELASQIQINDAEEHLTEDKWITGPGEPKAEMEEEEGPDSEPVPPPPRMKKRKGSFLDDEMFSDEEEEEEYDEEEEEWEEIDEEDDEDWGEEKGEGEFSYITCRCGARIPVTSDERPYRFECEDCGRSGTLK
ncbi:MAG: tetratricopeptide repeat protein [Candidatus Thermoplasmatota archaeon]|nr:tetratricopeptide repeat protein [Candidatus Thermoplasmatota archaeon]